MMFIFYWDVSEQGTNIRCFTQSNLVSFITAGSVISGFSKKEITVNVVSYGSNTLWYVLRW